MSGKQRPPLRRIHTDETLTTGASWFSLTHWRKQKTQEIVESLQPGKREALRVKSDGRIINGNVRIKVLEERGFDVDGLEREPV